MTMTKTILLSLEDAKKLLPLLQKTKVVAGGCFDIIHPGHTSFLTACKQHAECLIVLLESDQKIKEIKGEDRPKNTQEKRAKNLTELQIIDYIILLPYLSKNAQYDQVIFSLKPDIIATTLGDPYRYHKERQAMMIKAKVIDVIDRLHEYSTTKMLHTL
jgi:cytidyltransferase-like protein